MSDDPRKDDFWNSGDFIPVFICIWFLILLVFALQSLVTGWPS